MEFIASFVGPAIRRTFYTRRTVEALGEARLADPRPSAFGKHPTTSPPLISGCFLERDEKYIFAGTRDTCHDFIIRGAAHFRRSAATYDGNRGKELGTIALRTAPCVIMAFFPFTSP